ncbi:MAG: hypothetical protein H0X29_11105 [Parachlamydiaceae bacterium]|nr:hypothetical protein [Parachlamydiaceae bacterium]
MSLQKTDSSSNINYENKSLSNSEPKGSTFVRLKKSSSSLVSALKIGTTNPFSKMKSWTNNKIENLFEKEVKWKNEEGKPINIKISALSLKLGVSKHTILKYENEGNINTLTNQRVIEKLKKLESLSKELNLPIQELLLPKSNLELNKYIQENTEEVNWSNENNELKKIPISELASKLKISEEKIIKFVQQDGQDLGKLKDLERLSKTMELPFIEIFESSESGKLDEYIFHATADLAAKNDLDLKSRVDEKCKNIFANLDALYLANKDPLSENSNLITQNSEGQFVQQMTPKELESIKKVIKSSLMIFDKIHPKKEQIISDSNSKHRILVEKSGDSLKITALFGKLLGVGGAGVAIRPIDLSTGNLATGEGAVIKKPINTDNDAEIIREFTLLKKIHAEKEILGIQRPVRLIRDVMSNTEAQVVHIHSGAIYETDLQDILEPKGNREGLEPQQRLLSLEDGTSIAYQLLHGVSHLHEQSITHGDIKPGNMFCNFKTSDEETAKTGPHLYLADLGGSIDHTEKDSVNSETTGTPEYRPEIDAERSLIASKAGFKDLHMHIEKKVDVFASCSVICSIFTNELPYSIVEEGSVKRFVIKEGLEKQLIDRGLSLETVTLLIKGMAPKHDDRPDIIEIFKVFETGISSLGPEREKFLRENSKPLT